MFAKDVPICIPVSGSVLVDIIIVNTSVYCAKISSVLLFLKNIFIDLVLYWQLCVYFVAFMCIWSCIYIFLSVSDKIFLLKSIIYLAMV